MWNFWIRPLFKIKEQILVMGDQKSIRERPFNLKGVIAFKKKIILIPNVAEKNIFILMEEKKKKYLIQSVCHITYCWILENKFALCTKKLINILILVLSAKKISERNEKP